MIRFIYESLLLDVKEDMSRYLTTLKTLYFIDLLKLAKKRFSWVEISGLLNESPTVLSRYLHGHVLPNPRKVDKMIPILEKLIDLRSIVISKIKRDKRGFINNQYLISDINLLKLLALKFSWQFKDKVDIVFSPAADGIPFATLVAEYTGTNIVIVKNRREVGVQDFIEGVHITEDGQIETLYFPRKLIRKNYRVLIVDDVIRTGETHKTIVDMVDRAKAKVVSILVILAVGNRWRSVLKDVPVTYIAHI